MDTVVRFLVEAGVESARLLDRMAIYVLFGLLVAGALHTYVPSSWLVRNLSGGRVWPAIKASLIGIPLPLCSCGVLPAVISLRRDGASRGAVISFLVATPTTGVDSILATYALLGKVFAVYRVLASFIAGTVAGIVSSLVGPSEDPRPAGAGAGSCGCSSCELPESSSAARRLAAMLHYAFVELLGDIGKWLLIGIAVGGIITALIPADWVQHYLGSGWRAMLVMLVIGIPLYVCATASIPIAAALMLKGMSPGAAFVFLLVGPATNAVSVTFVTRYLGRMTTVVYLATLSVSALLLGRLLDWTWKAARIGDVGAVVGGHEFFPVWLTVSCSAGLVGLIGWGWLRRPRADGGRTATPASMEAVRTVLRVPGMNCPHCEGTVRSAVEGVPGVTKVSTSVGDRRVEVLHDGTVPPEALAARVRSAGFGAEILEDPGKVPGESKQEG